MSTDGVPECLDGAGADAPEMGLELGKGHFDRIEVWAVGRQEEEPGAALLEDRLGLFALVAGEVVEDDHVARLQRRRELGLDIGVEDRCGSWLRSIIQGAVRPSQRRAAMKVWRGPVSERRLSL